MIKRMMLVCVAVAGGMLTACSTTSTGVPVSDATQGGMSSMGVGSGATFSRQEKGEVYTTKAPREQIYLFAFDILVFVQKNKFS